MRRTASATGSAAMASKSPTRNASQRHNLFGDDKHTSLAPRLLTEAAAGVPPHPVISPMAAMSKYSRWRCDSIMTGQGQVEPASHAISLDRRINRGRVVRHNTLIYSCPDLAKCQGIRPTETGDFTQIGAHPRKQACPRSQGEELGSRTAENLNLLRKSNQLPAHKAIHSIVGRPGFNKRTQPSCAQREL
jgi:hypothetical protein